MYFIRSEDRIHLNAYPAYTAIGLRVLRFQEGIKKLEFL